MSEAAVADQFLYTAACFGNAGSEGFQFIGLPEAGASQEIIDLIEHHIGYTAPIDAQPTPSDVDIEAGFPVSVRLLFPDSGEQVVLISTRYVGRTYRAGGERGKWGNFFAHALLLRSTPDPRTLAALAGHVTWRTELTEQEHRAGRTLSLPAIKMRASLEASNSRERDAELLAAVLCRLSGGPPVLLIDIDHRAALNRYASVQGLLPATLARRLSWSTYEFDGACGYDVIATRGQTQLSLSPAGYIVVGTTEVPTACDWAARKICESPQDFWEEVIALSGARSEPDALKTTIETLTQFASADEPSVSLVTAAFANIRSQPAETSTAAAARRLFERVFPPERLSDFTVLAAAASEAQAFAAWSGFDEWTAEICRLVARTVPVIACFKPAADPQPLKNALIAATRAGLPVEKSVLLVLDAHQHHLSSHADASTLHSAIHMFLREALASRAGRGGRTDDSWARVLVEIARSAEHWGAVTRLIKAEAKFSGGQWVDGVLSTLEHDAADFMSAQSPTLVEYLLLEGFAGQPGEVAWRVSALRRLPAGHLKVSQLATLVEELDSHIGQAGKESSLLQLAVSLSDFFNEYPPQVRAKDALLANSICLMAAHNSDAALALVNDETRIKAIAKRAAPSCYFALALAAWTECENITDAKDRKSLFVQLWREDLEPQFSTRILERLSAELARSRTPLEFLAAALSAIAGSSKVQLAWRGVVEQLAHQIVPKLSDSEFDGLIELRGLNKELREALQARRNYSLRGLWTIFGKLTQSAVKRVRGRR